MFDSDFDPDFDQDAGAGEYGVCHPNVDRTGTRPQWFWS